MSGRHLKNEDEDDGEDDKRSYMKIYFDDPEYDGQFLRAIDYAPAGAQIGEAWAIAAQIQAGDATSWYNAWSSPA